MIITPDQILTLFGAFAVALAPTIAILVSNHHRVKESKATATKLDTIHILVNSRLTEALAEIKELKSRLGDPED